MRDKHAIWKWLILIGALAFSMVTVMPPGKKIRLGIDLIGGTSITVELDQAAIREEARARLPEATDGDIEAEVGRILRGAQERTLEVIRNRVDNLGVSEPIIYPAQGSRIIVQLPGADAEQIAQAEDAIKRAAYLQFRIVHPDNVKLTGDLFAKRLSPEGYRIEQSGSGNYYVRDESYATARLDETYKARLGRFMLPDPAYEFMLEKMDVDARTMYAPRFVKRRPELTGEYLEDASVDYGNMGECLVHLRFDSKGAKKFAQVTADFAPGGARNPNPNEYRQLAIVLDETLYSAPRINEAIYGGRAQIEGRFTFQEAQFLSNVLRAGSLPAPVRVVEKRTVSPTLGTDSIRSGVRAISYGALGVVIFMPLYYLLAGIVADLALLITLLLLPLGMVLSAGFLGIFVSEGGGGGPIQLPVLTLPGIAGILLTIGMAVDANVLIFERIREESGAGKRLWTSIEAGFDRAYVTIVDANVTTLLTGLILFIFGSGPIRGFAVTLCAGILMSMFTALVVTKLLLGALDATGKVKSLRMLSIIKDTAFDFIGKRKFCAIISIVAIVASWGVLVSRGVKDPGRVFGVDFTGGAELVYSFDERQPIETVREVLNDAGVSGLHIQYQEAIEGDEGTRLQVKVGTENIGGEPAADVVKRVMSTALPQAGFTLEQDDEVGGQVGKELTGRAIKSIIIALVGIIIYLWIRFELGFAVGAIVALAHDVLLTVGLYSLFGRQLSLPIVAALLTIVGYSVNDTIVVFDRIREDLRLVRNKTFKEICNLSVNQTLSRTLLTSGTTLITVMLLLIVGGGAIFDFALTLFIGVVVGTYSSIYVATPVVLLWHHDHRPDFGKSAS